MSFLGGTIASVRNHLSSIGTGVGNGGRSRRHTISNVVTSSCPPLSGRAPAGILKVDKSNTDRAGRSSFQDSPSNALPPKRNRRKSVTFSSVDTITHLPTVSVSAASSQTRPLKTPETSVHSRRNSTSTLPGSTLPSGVSNRHVTDAHRAPTDLPKTRRYTVSGPPVPTQGTHTSYSPLEWEGNHDRSLKSTQRSRRHSTLAPPSDYHPLDNRRGYEWQPPSGYVALGYQDSSPRGCWYDLPSTTWAGATAFLPGENPPFGQPYSSLPGPYGVYYNPYEYPAQGYGIQPPHYSIIISPTSYFSAPPSRPYPECAVAYNSNRITEYTILPLSSRFSPTHAHSYTECLALLDTRTASLVPSHFPPPKYIPQGTERFLISHARNKKGLGMFAQKPLRTGEVILTEIPTLIIPSDAGPARDASTVWKGTYEKIFELLSDGVKRDLMDLSWQGDYRSDVDVYETIMRINPLAVSLPLSSAPGCSTTGVSSIYRGIFLKTSRCNHSCGPNAQWSFDPYSLTLFLTCLRPINAGDEISITYNSPYLPFFHRRADLKNLFGFDCTCDSCLRILSQPQENIQSRLIEESDSARKFLTTFWDSYPSFEAWSQNPSIYPDSNLLISAHKVALEIIEREGVEELSSVRSHHPQRQPSFGPVPDTIRHTDGIALCYGVLADLTNFRKWVARALDARSSHSGSGSEVLVAGCWGEFEDVFMSGNGMSRRLVDAQCQTENVREVLERWIANPEVFPAWGLRGFES